MGGSLKSLNDMLTQPLEFNRSRLSAIGLLVLLLVLFFLLIVYPLISLRNEYRETGENALFRLEHLEQVASGKDALSARLENIKRLAKTNEAFLPTNTAALATADLQTRIKQAVSDAGGELSSTQVIPERNEENAVRIGVKIRLTGSTPMLLKVLQNFESVKPYLFVENLNIRPIRMPINIKDKNAVVEDRLSVDFDVVGYMQAP